MIKNIASEIATLIGEKAAKTAEKTEKPEKTSAPESTGNADGASNKTKDGAESSKKEPVSKKE